MHEGTDIKEKTWEQETGVGWGGSNREVISGSRLASAALSPEAK